MRINYHKIDAAYNAVHKFNEYLYGVVNIAHGDLKPNYIRISNAIIIKLRVPISLNNNVIIKDELSKLINGIALRVNNNFVVKNVVKPVLVPIFRAKENKIIVQNIVNPLARIFTNINNNIYIKSHDLSLTHFISLHGGNNSLKILNEKLKSILRIKLSPNKPNTLVIKADLAQADAWRFATLGEISGTLVSYTEQTIEQMGRTKV